MARKAHSAAKKAEVEGSGTVVAVTEVEVTPLNGTGASDSGVKARAPDASEMGASSGPAMRGASQF